MRRNLFRPPSPVALNLRIAVALFPPQIAVQVALVYAKIARNDYPKEWPTLFQDLLSNLAGASSAAAGGGGSGGTLLVVRRVYLILHHIVKELSSKRLFADQKNFSEVRACVCMRASMHACMETKGAACMDGGKGDARHARASEPPSLASFPPLSTTPSSSRVRFLTLHRSATCSCRTCGASGPLPLAPSHFL